MKAPTWGTVIGILMIVFGGCSVMNDIQSINLPSMMEKQKLIFQEKVAEKEAEENLTDSITVEPVDSLDENTRSEEQNGFFGDDPKESIEKMLNLSEFTKTWIVRFGYIGIVISLLYALGGILLLTPKRFSIKVVYAALILSILFSVTQTIVLTSDSESGFIAMSKGFSQIFGIIVDIILLSVVFASDKEVYDTLEKQA